MKALQRFGRYGNSASKDRVAQWAGVGEGTVDKVTKRVIHAVLSSHLRTKHVRWPTGAEREAAKNAVEELSLAVWRNGWAMIDGT